MSPPGNLASKRSHCWLALSIAILAAVADQASKWTILERVMNPPRVIEVTSFFNLTLGFNRGVSFGLFSSDEAIGRWLLVGVALAIVSGLAAWAWRSESRTEAAAIGGIIGGAVGNVVDRVRQEAVTDFLDFHALGWHWPAFNLADTAIFCGVAILILHSWVGAHTPDASAHSNFKDKRGQI